MRRAMIGSCCSADQYRPPLTLAGSRKFSRLSAAAAALTVAAVIAVTPVSTWAQDMHATVVPPTAWTGLPDWIPYDVKLEDCEAKGGTISGARNPKLCNVHLADCESHPGFKVVERDAYRTGSMRLVACRRM
jgi:hypothetical protein